MSHVWHFAWASQLSPCSVSSTRRLFCSWLKTISWSVDHSYFLFHTVLSLPVFLLKIPTDVHSHSLTLLEKSIPVKALVPKWVRLDEPGWTPGKPRPALSQPSCLTSRDLPSPPRTRLLHQPLPVNPYTAVASAVLGGVQAHKLQLKNEWLFSLLFISVPPMSSLCRTDLDRQLLKDTGRKASQCASTYWVPKREKNSGGWGRYCSCEASATVRVYEQQ